MTTQASLDSRPATTRRARQRSPADAFLPMEHRTVLLRPIARWTAKRKDLLLRAIVDGVVTASEACQAHAISADELDEWARASIASWTTERLRATRRVPPP